MSEGWQMEPIGCFFNDLEDLVSLVFPAYINYTEDQKASYRSYIDIINPELELRGSRFHYSDRVVFCLPDPDKTIK